MRIIMYKIGNKYNCVWADWVQILYVKSNGELVMIDSFEEVHIKHPEDLIFDEYCNPIKFKELFENGK